MSTVIAKNVQVGADGTASNNFTVYQPATPDGTLRIGNGNSGTTSNLVTVTSAGNVLVNTTTNTNNSRVVVNGTIESTSGGVRFPDNTVQTTAAVSSPVDQQTFDSSGTWTKPTAGQTMCRIQVWGGGGGAGRSAGNASSGGGGGAYNELIVPLSFLGSSVSITVGTGGTGATVTGNGGVGGTSSVPLTTAVNGRSSVQAFGGGPGGDATDGGGGGGQLSAGAATGTSSAGSPVINTGQNLNLSLGQPGVNNPGFGGIWNGGGGAASTSLSRGGNALFGGGGGGGGNSASTGGVSVWGGGGGNGVSSGTGHTAGAQPGGGGGASGSGNTNGRDGGAGRVIITAW